MIIYKRDESIFDSTALYLVNPVNTKGVSGAGLALEMKKRFPENFKYYHEYCSKSSPKGGDLIWYIPEASKIAEGERVVINFCTKEDWKRPSKLEWIEKGIKQLIIIFEEKYLDGKYPTPLLALPMLGCGKGGLEVDYAKDTIWLDDTCKLPIVECCSRGRYFAIKFRIKNENRVLTVHFDCDCDYSEYEGSKIIWSVNWWGMAEEIILGVCNTMKQYGKVFYEANDYDGEVVEV